MMKRNIWVLTLLITLCSQLYGQASRGYGGYMLGLWSIDWNKLNNQITEFLVERYGDFVLYRPPLKDNTWLLWFGPFLFLIIAITTAIIFIKKQSQNNTMDN